MTLKEKIQDVDIEKGMSDRLEKIADEFAIGFFNWAKSYQSNDKNNWSLSTKELLKIYKEL